MRLQIRTLSPIHIGSGEKYNGLSYIVDKGKVLFYDSDKIADNITQQHIEKFVKWIEQRVSEIERLEKQKRDEKDGNKRRNLNHLLRDAQKKLSLKEFIASDITIRNKFSSNFLYSLEARAQVYNNVDIECFIKQNNKPYIPGTEIKGAIRTAIAYYLLNTDSAYSCLKDELLKLHSKLKNTFSLLGTCGKRGRDFLTIIELQSIPEHEFIEIFGKRGYETFRKINSNTDPKLKINTFKKSLVEKAGKIEEALQNKIFRANGKTDAKYDLLKFLYIGDSEFKEPSECLFVSDLKTLNISKTFPLFQELCRKNQVFTCQYFKLDNNRIILEKLDFSDIQKKVVSDAKNLFQCCYEFTERLLREEIEYFTKNSQPKIVAKLKNIKQLNTPDSPVIRIGKDEGYLSVTVGLLVKDRDGALYDQVFCHLTKNTSHTGNFPKTRKIINLENGDIDTCGWVKLIQI